MSSIISKERALYSLNNRELDQDDTTILQATVDASSTFVQKYCAKDFVLQTYTEITQGTGFGHSLFLKQCPVYAITRIAIDPEGVLKIRNTSTSNQIATAATTSTGLSLARIASGTQTVDATVLWASYATVALAEAAVDALGNGWDADVPNSTYDNWPSSLLYEKQGPFGCANSEYVELKLHTTVLGDEYDLNAQTGELSRDSSWPTRSRGVYVKYEAGYESIPEDVQEACAELAAALFLQTKRDPALIMERTADYTYQTHSVLASLMTQSIKNVLDHYKRRRV